MRKFPGHARPVVFLSYDGAPWPWTFAAFGDGRAVLSVATVEGWNEFEHQVAPGMIDSFLEDADRLGFWEMESELGTLTFGDGTREVRIDDGSNRKRVRARLLDGAEQEVDFALLC